MTLLIALSAPVLLALLLWAEKKEHTGAKLIFKQILSAFFVIVAGLRSASILSFGSGSGFSYGHWVLMGLILSWAGDLFLVFSARKVFLAGLVSFLLAHCCYTVAFFSYGTQTIWLFVGIVAVLTVSIVTFLWPRPHLGNMKIPVIAYIGIISAMVCCAMALFANFNLPAAGRWYILIGAILFFVSDITVARDRFVAPGFNNCLYGLPLYYLAQFLFAYSVAEV